MRVVGIAAEYNPFHNGHSYHIEQSKKQTGAEACVVVMSGQFSQRGGPCILDKFERTKMALSGGADLVIELPYCYAGQSAEFFSWGCVGLLHQLGFVTHMSFGSENDDMMRLKKIAKLLEQETPEFKADLKKYLKRGYSYPKARQIAAENNCGELLPEMTKPNCILGIEYLRVLARLNTAIEPVLIMRKGAVHGELTSQKKYASAAYIRTLIKRKEFDTCERFVPESVLQTCQAVSSHDLQQFSAVLKYLLLVKRPEELLVYPDVEIGLENRLKSYAQEMDDVENYIQQVSTSRYTKNRIRRILVNLLMNFKEKDRLQFKNYLPSYVRILGANEMGRELLKKCKETESLKIISNVGRDIKRLKNKDLEMLTWDLQASELYQLYMSEPHKDYRKNPFNL